MSKQLSKTLISVRGDTPRPVMAERLGVHNNTLAAYERAERLPDVDFLAAFAVQTGTPFLRLLRLRLEASEAPAARQVLEELRPGPVVSGGGQAQGMDWDLLREVIDALDEALEEADRVVKPGRRGELVEALYGLLAGQVAPKVNRAAVLKLVRSAI